MTDENAFAEWWNAAGTARRRECALNLQAENARLRAEIESLRGAPVVAPEPLTKEKLDAMIKEIREEIGREGYDVMKAFEIFWRGMDKFRDALLESAPAEGESE